MSAHNEVTELANITFNGGRCGLILSTAAPTDSIAGFAPGCLWLYSVDSASYLYINTGTASSTTWTKVGTQS